MKGIKKPRVYPEATVPQEICVSGKVNPNCPYLKDSFTIPDIDVYNTLKNPEDMI